MKQTNNNKNSSNQNYSVYYYWIQGDMHIENFGTYFDYNNNEVIYGLNDFDDSVMMISNEEEADNDVAYYYFQYYDVYRMATSIVLQLIKDQQQQEKVNDDWDKVMNEQWWWSQSKFVKSTLDSFITSYLDSIKSNSKLMSKNIDETKNEKKNDNKNHLNEKKKRDSYTTFTSSNTYGKLDNFIRDVEKKHSRQKMLDKWTTVTTTTTTTGTLLSSSPDLGKIRKFDTHKNKKLEILDSKKDPKWEEIQFQFYRQYISTTTTKASSSSSSSLSLLLENNRTDDYYFTYSTNNNNNSNITVDRYWYIKDIAKRKYSGTGSLGLERYYILLEGPSTSLLDDIILDMKLQILPTPMTPNINSTTTSSSSSTDDNKAILVLSKAQDHYKEKFGLNHAKRYIESYKALLMGIVIINSDGTTTTTTTTGEGNVLVNNIVKSGQEEQQQPSLLLDPHLGWMYLPSSEGYFVIKERSPYKETLDLSKYITTQQTSKKKSASKKKKTQEDWESMVQQWGHILATCHLQSRRGIISSTTTEKSQQPQSRPSDSTNTIQKEDFLVDIMFYATQTLKDYLQFTSSDLLPKNCEDYQM